MKTKKLLLFALLSACMLPSISQAKKTDKESKQAPDSSKIFQQLDVDQSGSLSSDEVSSNKKLTKRFTRFDKDKDGKLSLQEFEATQKSKGKKKSKKEKTDTDPQ